MNIADIRTDYRMAALDEATAGDNPISFFSKWFTEAEHAQITEVNAMTLATVDAQNKPHARIVLLKGLDERGFSFYTNYNSAKGKDMSAHPEAALVFFWKELERQVRVEGRIERVSDAESDAYFNSRPEGSRLGAWASPQSEEITDRHILDKRYTEYKNKYPGNDIPRPPYWGGYRVLPTRIEFWQGRSNRMHDRIVFTENGSEGWTKSRLAP